MIGNDIVDLNLAKTQSNWQRKGFLEKQFTEKEQEVILKANDSFLQVWLFWSLKEAAYKCYTQEYQKRFFAPQKFSCKIISETTGTVEIENVIYYVNYIKSDNYIHSFASKEKKKKMISDIIVVDKKSSSSKIINNKIQSLFPYKITVQKNDVGIPYVYKEIEKLPISISKSHHGNYGGFVITIKNES